MTDIKLSVCTDTSKYPGYALSWISLLETLLFTYKSIIVYFNIEKNSYCCLIIINDIQMRSVVGQKFKSKCKEVSEVLYTEKKTQTNNISISETVSEISN